MTTYYLILKSYTEAPDIELEVRADKFEEAANYFYEQLDERFDLETIKEGMYED